MAGEQVRGANTCGGMTFDDVDRAARVLEAMVSGIDVDTLTGEGATRLVKRLVVHERVVASVRAKAAKRAADANQWRHAGERSPASWLASLTGTTTGQAAAELETAEKLVDLPATAAARAAGQLSESQARQVADAATADPAAEADLLAHAATDDAAALARRCLAVKAAAERDETAAREKIRRARRHRSWTDGEGAFCYAGRGLPEDRAALEAAMKPYQDQAFHAARRRGERETSEVYAYDALIALANHQCPTSTTGTAGTQTPGTDTTPAPGADDGTRLAAPNSGTDTTPTSDTCGADDGTSGATCSSSADDTARAATLWDGTTSDTSTTTSVAAGKAPTWGTAAPSTEPSRTGDGATGTRPAGAATDTPVTDAQEARATPTDQTADAGSTPSGNGDGRAGIPATSTGDTGTGDDAHAGEGITGATAYPAVATSTSGAADAATGIGTGTAGTTVPAPMSTSDAPGTGVVGPRFGNRAKVIVRIDHTALVRGHTVPGEVCEIAGVGPISVATARELARDAFLTAVVTDGIDVRTVAHLGRAATAHQRTALEARGIHCAVPGCGVVHHLQIDHVDGWTLTRRTQLDQLDWLCRFHHRQKTHHSYHLAGPPGQRTWHPPGDPPPETPPGPD